MNAGPSSLLRTSVQPFLSFLRASVLPSAASNFAFCSTTYVRPLSHLSLLSFVTFVFFTLRCHLFFILRCHLFFFINSCVLSYHVSFLLPHETCGGNMVISNVCCSSVCCSLNYYTSLLFVLNKYRNLSRTQAIWPQAIGPMHV